MTQHSPPVPDDPLNRVFAYRAFDLRDRFPQPLDTFREALECLQSDRAYLPSWRGEIVAYLRGGDSIPIPERFFLLVEGDIVLLQHDGVTVKHKPDLAELEKRIEERTGLFLSLEADLL